MTVVNKGDTCISKLQLTKKPLYTQTHIRRPCRNLLRILMQLECLSPDLIPSFLYRTHCVLVPLQTIDLFAIEISKLSSTPRPRLHIHSSLLHVQS